MATRSRADVERMLLQRGNAGIPRLEAGETRPLSFAQERMWLLERISPNVSAYNVPRLLQFAGRLDEGALQQALDVVAARHTTIRTSIAIVDGNLTQKVDDDQRITLELHDLQSDSAAASVDELVSELAWRRFDLERDALVRAALLRLPDRDRLLLVSHHLVSDHGSARILLSELAEAYGSARAGRDTSLPELPIQYADYAAWQRVRIAEATLDELTAYWKTRLAGAPERFDLPFDKPRPPAKTYKGAEHRAVLPAALADDLRALARTRNVSYFTVLLAGFYALLHRYTDGDDIVIGTPVSGRHHEETQGLIGYFSNTLALRMEIDGDVPFDELIQRVRTTVFEALAYQELPFERLVETLNPPRDPSHTPVFQVLFAYDVAPSPVEFDGAAAETLPLPSWPGSRFDLSMGTQDRHDGGVDVVVEYSTDLFDAVTVERMIGHFATLLRSAADEPARPVGTLAILSEPEERMLVDDWNRTDRTYDQRCLHELFAEQAAKTPERTAVTGSGRSLTYRELDERANRLARHLRRLGVAPGSLVGLCLDRVPETMVAILGVLKAGAAYVPIEPTYPEDRKAFMLEDAQPPVLLTEEALVESLPAHTAQLLCLDRDWAELEAEPATAPDETVDADALAYVIYTSGSTGRPKGVEIRHRSVVNLMTSMRERPGIDEDDVVVNVTTPAFDLSVPDLYLPLLNGARLVIVPREQTQDPARLADALDEAGATFMQATPTTWRLLVEAGWEGRPGLKIVCGGEALPRSLANELLDRGASLWHMYGPTETTVWSSTLELGRGHGFVPIGGPIANTRFYVADRHLRPQPIGVAGELLIGGDGVARGYRGRPDLTADRFVDDPVDALRGAVYRTGDRMRFRADGTLEFLGRLDHQVKLHGYRIELGEIESALDSHPDVQQSVAVVHQAEHGERQLVAYVVAENGHQPAPADLRRHVGQFVPSYAVPSAIITLEELPRTANGKLDVKALPRPEVRRSDLDTQYVPPQTAAEEALAEIWLELLPIDRVGADDDFFALGGHSLLAVKMLARLHTAFGVEIPLTTAFEHSTLSALAAEIGRDLIEDVADDRLALLLRELEADG